MKPLYLKFVNTGVGNRFELKDYDLIEMNKKLKMYPELFYAVLMHELAHSEDNSNLKDFKYDMKSKTPGLFKFMIKHPSAMTQVLPFYWDIKKNKLVYDVSYIVSWIMILGTTVGVYFLMRIMMRWIL